MYIVYIYYISHKHKPNFKRSIGYHIVVKQKVRNLKTTETVSVGQEYGKWALRTIYCFICIGTADTLYDQNVPKIIFDVSIYRYIF